MRCYDKAINCIACESTNTTFTCLGCRTGYYLSTTSNNCMPCTSFCQVCNSSTCLQCQISYFLTSNGTCQACNLPNCLTCLNSTTCTACSTGTFLSTVATCEQCITGCAQCQSTTGCTQCSPSFYLNSGICYQCDPQCVNCADAENLCIGCQYGFYQPVPNSRCLPCP